LFDDEQISLIASRIASLKHDIVSQTGGKVSVSEVAKLFSATIANRNQNFNEEAFLTACGFSPESREFSVYLKHRENCDGLEVRVE